MVATRSSASSAPSENGGPDGAGETGGAGGAGDDIVILSSPPRRRWATVAWYVLLAVIAGLSMWSARTTTFGSRGAANVALAPAPGGCALVEAVDASGSLGGRPLDSFRADAGGPAGSCVSGVEPTVAVALVDTTAASNLPGSALVDATSFESGTVAHPTLQVELLRASSPTAVADVVRISDGDRTVSVATIWSSIDPIDGAGPGAPDVHGAVTLAEALLAV